MKFHPALSAHHSRLRMRYAALANYHRGRGWNELANYLERRAREHAAQAVVHALWGFSTAERGPRRPDDGGLVVPELAFEAQGPGAEAIAVLHALGVVEDRAGG